LLKKAACLSFRRLRETRRDGRRGGRPAGALTTRRLQFSRFAAEQFRASGGAGRAAGRGAAVAYIARTVS